MIFKREGQDLNLRREGQRWRASRLKLVQRGSRFEGRVKDELRVHCSSSSSSDFGLTEVQIKI